MATKKRAPAAIGKYADFTPYNAVTTDSTSLVDTQLRDWSEKVRTLGEVLYPPQKRAEDSVPKRPMLSLYAKIVMAEYGDVQAYGSVPSQAMENLVVCLEQEIEMENNRDSIREAAKTKKKSKKGTK